MAPRLHDCGWRLAVFHRLPQLRTALEQDEPDLLLLELRVTGDQALSAIRDWRRQGLACPVLILSALADAGHRIDGLAAGANDYLAKPFHLAELTWRIEHLLLSSQPRRLRQHAMDRPIPLGPLMLQPAQSSLRNPQGDEVRLTRGDLALLLALLSQPHVVHPRSALLRASGSLVDTTTSRTLDVRLSRLRRLLNEASAGAVGIACVRGRGYRLTVSPSAAADPKTLQALTVAALPIGLSQSLPLPLHASPVGLFLLALPLGLASVLCWMRTVGQRIAHPLQMNGRKNDAAKDLHACCHALVAAYPPGSVQVDVPHRPLTVDADLLSPALHHLLNKALAHGHAPVRLRAEPQPSAIVLVIEGISSLRPPTDPRGTTSVQPDHAPGTDGVLEFCRQAQATLEFREPLAGGVQIRLSWGGSAPLGSGCPRATKPMSRR